jgi:hypothetical protein
MESNLVKARSSIVWLLAIACAFGAVWWIERQTGQELIAKQAPTAPSGAKASAAADPLQPSTGIPAEPAPRALTEQEKQWARIAWTYFENNTDPETGLVHSVEGFPSATLWDTSSYLLALIAARDLDLIEKRSFDIRMAKALVSLERMPLQDGKLPNKTYDTASLAMTDYANKPAPAGIGWSAIDIGRLLVPLNVIAWHHTVHTEAARRVIARWDTSQLARDGELFGLQAAAGAEKRSTQEGRLGYEQYAARTFALMGLDVDVAGDWRKHLRLVDVEGVQVCADDRDPQQFGAQNFVVSEPYVLAGLEFGWTRAARECAWRAYRAQEARFRKTGVLTAVSEDHVDQAPFFVYNSLWTAGKPWATVTEKGEDATALRSLSTKAAFGWHALLRTEYTGQLVAKVSPLNDPAKGFYAGLYEEGARPNKALTANTNAVVLESLAYIARGRSLNYR